MINLINFSCFNAVPTIQDFELYFNIAFFSMLGIGLLIGFLKGFKKALWSFTVTLIFIVFFFYTIDLVVNLLWTYSIPSLGSALSSINPAFAEATSLSEALPIAIQSYLPEYEVLATNANFLEFSGALSMFVVKIIYTILYFTVIQLLYRLILWIVKALVTPSKKKSDKYKHKNRGLGALMGLLQGGVSLYVTIIIFGGLMSISDSMTNLVSEPAHTQMSHVEFVDGFAPANQPVIEMEPLIPPIEVGDMEGAVNLLNDMVTAYNENYVITYSNMLTMTSPYDETEQMPLNLYLFDSVLSMTYQEEQIAIRAEVDVLTEAAGLVLNSDFVESSSINDLSSTEVRSVFSTIANSHLITKVLPVGIESAALLTEVDLQLPIEELYEIEWSAEISQLGEVAGVALDIINAAGISFDEETDLETVQLDGDDVGELFTELGDSQLATLGAYVAMEPLLEDASEEMQALITVPEDMDWAAEFDAIGALASSVLNAGLTLGDVSDPEIGTLLSVIADIDFTLVIDSRLMTNAMINILSGDAGIELPEFLVVPDDIEWHNTLNGTAVVYGEIYNILSAVSTLANSASGLDFDDLDNIGINTIAEFTASDVNALFESKIMVASITQFIKDLDLGDDFELVIPDMVYDVEGYLLKTELQNIVEASLMMVNNLTCDVGDTACEEIGVDLEKILTLDTSDLDTMFDSEILYTTIANLIYEQTIPEPGEEAILTIPGSVMETLNVEGLATDFISKQEVKNTFLAVQALDIESIEDISVDESILTNLAIPLDDTTLDETKADTVFGSDILNATISNYMFGFTDDAESPVVVPYKAEDNVELIRYMDSDGVTEVISSNELKSVVRAILKLDIDDFGSLDTLDISNLTSNMDTVLESSILHATISNQFVDLEDPIIVPSHDISNTPVIITVGSGAETNTYVAEVELRAAFDALTVLNINDVESVSMDLNILNRLADDSDPTVLDTNKSDKIFASAIMSATMSKYIIGESENPNPIVQVPEKNEADNFIRQSNSYDGTEFITEAELTNLLRAVLAINLTDFNTVETLNMTTIVDNKVVLLDSCIIQATISKQVTDIESNDVVVPEVQEDNLTEVIIERGTPGNESTYIVRSELDALFEALKVLGINNVDGFNGNLDLLTLQAPGAVDTVVASTIMQASISKKVIDMEDDLTATTEVVVPYNTPDGSVLLRRSVGTVIIEELVLRDEIRNLLNAFVSLGFSDVNDVSSAITIQKLSDNAATIFESYIIQATVSNEVIGTEITNPDDIEVPFWGDDLVTPEQLRFTSGPVGLETEFIKKAELINLMAGLNEIIDPNQSISSFNGSVDISDFYEVGTRTVLLNSFILQASISEQIIAMPDNALEVPLFKADDSTVVSLTAGAGIEASDYMTDTELHALFEALELFGITSVDSFDASTLNFAMFLPSHGVGYEDNQDTLLASASIQATVSSQVLDIGPEVSVPRQDIDSSVVHITIASGTDFVTVTELKYLFNALDVMNLTSVNSFTGNIDLSLLGTSSSQDTIIRSAITHATLSDKILDTTLLVPDTDINRSVTTRVTVLTQEFIEKIETKALLASLFELGMSNYNAMDLDLSTILTKDMNIVLASASIQATMSDNFLLTAKTYPSAASGEFIVPTAKRQSISVDSVVKQWIEIVELKAIITSLDTAGISSFSISLGGNALNGKTPSEINTILSSASMHLTVEKMIKSNSSLSVPDITGQVVIADSLLGLTDIITQAETVNFVVAMNTFNGSLNGSIDINDLTGLTEAEKTLVITSAIARCELTPSLELILAGAGIAPVYETLDTAGDACLTLASAQAALDA